ncbi:MAG: hypothetical protein AAFY29_04825 [Pseudomonadota bacterium]
MRLAIGGVLLFLALTPVSASSFRMLIDLPSSPAPGSDLFRRAAQSYDVDSYFALRGSIALDSATPLLRDPVVDAGSQSAGPVPDGKDLPQLEPRADELIVLGFNENGEWVFLDYITDPWLVRGEFLSAPGDDGRTPMPNRFYKEEASLFLTLPTGLNLHTVELIRPTLRNGLLVVTPLVRMPVPRD